jgi:hypothetical protein
MGIVILIGVIGLICGLGKYAIDEGIRMEREKQIRDTQAPKPKAKCPDCSCGSNSSV